MTDNPHSVKNQLLKISLEKEITVEEMSIEVSKDLRNKVLKKFTNGCGDDNFIWSSLLEENSIFCRNDNSWLLLDDFIKEQKTYMFFNKSDCARFFCFSSGEDIVSILHDSSFSDMYFIDEDLNFLITYSHHDILTASGTAAAWLEALIDDQGNLLAPLVY
jgi:hypothetical protein